MRLSDAYRAGLVLARISVRNKLESVAPAKPAPEVCSPGAGAQRIS